MLLNNFTERPQYLFQVIFSAIVKYKQVTLTSYKCLIGQSENTTSMFLLFIQMLTSAPLPRLSVTSMPNVLIPMGPTPAVAKMGSPVTEKRAKVCEL